MTLHLMGCLWCKFTTYDKEKQAEHFLREHAKKEQPKKDGKKRS